MKRRASALVQYSLVLGVVSLALVAMNTYIKRGLQGKVKDLTDTHISAEQVGDSAGSKATGSSKSETQADSSVASERSLGGATHLENKETSQATISGAGGGALIDRPYIPDFVSAEEVFLEPPRHGSEDSVDGED